MSTNTWHGPTHPGEFPTLGHVVADWIEKHLVVPDGPLAGQPYRLTDEQVHFLLWHYRLELDGRRTYPPDRQAHGEQMGDRPPDVLAAVEAFGPVTFDGWDADGEPVGRPAT